MKLLRLFAVLFLAATASAQTVKAKSVTKEGDVEVVTLETGAICRVYVPKSIKKGETPGMVLSLHGHGGNPESMIQYGRDVAEHRGDVWVAYRGGEAVGPGFGYNSGHDEKDVIDVARYAIATYKVDPKRVIAQGFSAGGAMSCLVIPKNKELFAGFVLCAAPDTPGGRGGDPKGLRVVIFLGDQDQNFALAPQAKKAVENFKPNVAFRAITGLGHSLPDPIYLNDAFNFILDGSEKGDEKTLPIKPEHSLAPPKGRSGPPADYADVVIAWKTSKGPAGVTRNKLQAKSMADARLAKLRKGELTLEEALKESDDAESKEKGGAVDMERLTGFGKKVADKAKAMKPETWEMVETDGAYHLLYRMKSPG